MRLAGNHGNSALKQCDKNRCRDALQLARQPDQPDHSGELLLAVFSTHTRSETTHCNVAFVRVTRRNAANR